MRAAMAGKAVLDAVGRQQRDPIIAVLAGADDGLVVARDGPGERVFGVGDRALEAPPNEPALLALRGERRLDLAHPRRIGQRVRARVMGIVAEDERVAFSGPGALQIRDRVLRARAGERRAEQRQCEDEIFHCLPPCADAVATMPANPGLFREEARASRQRRRSTLRSSALHAMASGLAGWVTHPTSLPDPSRSRWRQPPDARRCR